MEESQRSSQGEEPVVGAFAVPEPRGDDGIEIGLAGLLEVAPDAMVVIDGDGRIVAFNAKLTKLFGYDSNALRGQAIEA